MTLTQYILENIDITVNDNKYTDLVLKTIDTSYKSGNLGKLHTFQDQLKTVHRILMRNTSLMYVSDIFGFFPYANSLVRSYVKLLAKFYFNDPSLRRAYSKYRLVQEY